MFHLLINFAINNRAFENKNKRSSFSIPIYKIFRIDHNKLIRHTNSKRRNEGGNKYNNIMGNRNEIIEHAIILYAAVLIK